MKTLYVVPARGGSKSISDKNIKLLAGRPLIWYTLDVITELAEKEDICVTTDSEQIAACVAEYGIDTPFMRPPELATDSSGQFEVLKHAVGYYRDKGINYERIVLMQPTSPFRRIAMVREAIDLYRSDLDMIVSVSEASANPYFVLFEENSDGLLVKSKEGHFNRRQDCPKVWQLNGSVYVINSESLNKHKSFSDFRRVVKYVMPPIMSVDIDNELDWEFSEFIALKHNIVK